MKIRPRAFAAMFSLGFLLPVAGFSQGPPRNPRSATVDSELARSRTEVLQKTKETRAGAEKLLALHEAELRRVTEEYERRRELYFSRGRDSGRRTGSEDYIIDPG